MKFGLKFLSCCAILVSAAALGAAQLKIGWAAESIDPGRPGVMPGFGSFRYSYGCEDPIYATALVIENGQDAVIFVSMDIISSKEILPEVVAAAKKTAPELPADKFFINATHTHSSLNIYYDMTGVPKEMGLMDKSEVKRFIAQRVVKAAQKAWANRKSGKIAWGYGLGVTAFNRRMVYSDDLSKRPKGKYGSDIPYAGHAVIHGVTSDSKFSGYENGADNFIQFLYTFDMQGKLTGAIINTAATSQFASSPQRKYTSDFWHDVREKIRSKYPDCYILPQCAAAGDLMPYGGHFLSAEVRRLRMKYGEKFLNDYGKTLNWQGFTEQYRKFLVYRKAMRMDTAERIFNTFEDTLKWAAKEKISDAVLRNKVVKVNLTPMPIPSARIAKARRDLEYWTENRTKTDGTLEERAEFHFRRNKTLKAAAGFIERDARNKKGGKHRSFPSARPCLLSPRSEMALFSDECQRFILLGIRLRRRCR